MTFEEAYKELEKDFRRLVDEDRRDRGIESIYLPNVNPPGPVDYVLVGMEPSLRGWAKDFEDAQCKIDCGFRNFFGFGNFCDYPVDGGLGVLFFCIVEYLCRDGEMFYLTDLAKGAMPTGSPGAGDRQKYEAWYPILEKELGLVSKPSAKIVSIGSTVRDFLAGKWLYRHAGTIVHYSGTAAGHYGKEIKGREDLYAEFAKSIQSLPNGDLLSESKKKLIFDYKIAFERIRSQDATGWPGWQREWQRRMM